MLAPAGHSLLTLETPRLILDLDRLERNCAAMRARCEALGVALRPHLKTAKSVDVARIATNGKGGITVSTLKEAEHFASAGYRDILYAATIVPESSRTRRASWRWVAICARHGFSGCRSRRLRASQPNARSRSRS